MSKIKYVIFFVALLMGCSTTKNALPKTTSGNPLFEGWYADPEARIFGNSY